MCDSPRFACGVGCLLCPAAACFCAGIVFGAAVTAGAVVAGLTAGMAGLAGGVAVTGAAGGFGGTAAFAGAAALAAPTAAPGAAGRRTSGALTDMDGLPAPS